MTNFPINVKQEGLYMLQPVATAETATKNQYHQKIEERGGIRGAGCESGTAHPDLKISPA